MQVITRIAELRERLGKVASHHPVTTPGQPTVAFVPTMGNLHAGHGPVAERVTLVRAAHAPHGCTDEFLHLGARRQIGRPRDVEGEVGVMKLEACTFAEPHEPDAAHARLQVLRPAVDDERCKVCPSRIADHHERRAAPVPELAADDRYQRGRHLVRRALLREVGSHLEPEHGRTLRGREIGRAHV